MLSLAVFRGQCASLAITSGVSSRENASILSMRLFVDPRCELCASCTILSFPWLAIPLPHYEVDLQGCLCTRSERPTIRFHVPRCLTGLGHKYFRAARCACASSCNLASAAKAIYSIDALVQAKCSMSHLERTGLATHTQKRSVGRILYPAETASDSIWYLKNRPMSPFNRTY